MTRKKHILRFESRSEPLLSRGQFARRMAKNFGAATALVAASLFGGMLGYHLTEGMDWVDSFLNASMILSGMGPADQLKTAGGKVFAGLYALYSGLALILVSGVILAPLVHRMLHRFHMADEDKG